MVDGKGGSKYPRALDHFKCPPEVIAATIARAEEKGDTGVAAAARAGKPTTLYVTVTSNDLNKVMPHSYSYFQAGGLVCVGNGDNILRRHKNSGLSEVFNGFTRDDRQVVCSRHSCPFAQQGERVYQGKKMVTPAPCQARGRLFFLIWGLFRTGVCSLGMSSTALRYAVSTFEIAERAFGKIDGLPYLLRLAQQKIQTPNGLQDLYIPVLEIDPDFLDQRQAEVGQRLISGPSAALPSGLEDMDEDELLYETTTEAFDSEADVVNGTSTVVDGATSEEAEDDVFGPAPKEPEQEKVPVPRASIALPVEELRAKAAKASDGEAPKALREKTRELFGSFNDESGFDGIMAIIWGAGGLRTIGQCAATNNWLLAEKKKAEK